VGADAFFGMGRLKDALFKEVWTHLKSQPNCRTLLLSLNSPAAGPRPLRAAWGELQANRKAEGLKTKAGLKDVLSERGDLFKMLSDERAHQLIELTDAARAFDVGDHRLLSANASAAPPPAPPAPVGASLQSVTDDAIRRAAANAISAFKPSDDSGGSSSSTSIPVEGKLLPVGALNNTAKAVVAGDSLALLAPAKKKQKNNNQSWTAYRPIDDGLMPTRHPQYGYMDIVWTPEIAMKREEAKRKEQEFVWALFQAAENHDGLRKGVTLSQLGADFKVSGLKKEPQFKNVKLVEFLKQFEDVFEVDESMPGPGVKVRLQPGAQAALPGAEEMLEVQLQESMLNLPERIEDAQTVKQKMQALRIEIVHTVAKRGGCSLQDIGQDPRVQRAKQAYGTQKKLIDFLKIYTFNFAITIEAGTTMVKVTSTDCADQRMVETLLMKQQQATADFRGKRTQFRGPPPGAPPGAPPSASSNANYWAQQQQHLQTSAALQVAAGYSQALASAYGTYGHTGTGFSPPVSGFSPALPAQYTRI